MEMDRFNNLTCEVDWKALELGDKRKMTELEVNLSQMVADREKRIAELEAQIEKMKCCINDLVHLGEFDEHTNEEYLNYQVHEALKNAEQFIKEIKENDSIRKN